MPSSPHHPAPASKNLSGTDAEPRVASWEVVYGFDLIRGFAPASG
ncbi:hypothetical protein [Streptomyces marianii]|nr:hypothetical protein [Streptomyces marianii]